MFENTKTSNYDKTVNVETITENGRTRKVTKTTIKHPDGRIEERINEESLDGRFEPVDRVISYGKPDKNFNEHHYSEVTKTSNYN